MAVLQPQTKERLQPGINHPTSMFQPLEVHNISMYISIYLNVYLYLHSYVYLHPCSNLLESTVRHIEPYNSMPGPDYGHLQGLESTTVSVSISIFISSSMSPLKDPFKGSLGGLLGSLRGEPRPHGRGDRGGRTANSARPWGWWGGSVTILSRITINPFPLIHIGTILGGFNIGGWGGLVLGGRDYPFGFWLWRGLSVTITLSGTLTVAACSWTGTSLATRGPQAQATAAARRLVRTRNSKAFHGAS